MYCYISAAYKPWGDYLVEIDIGIWEEELNDENWAAGCLQDRTGPGDTKAGGSMSNCHGTPGRGRRTRARGDGRRLGCHEEDQADARPEQHHGPGQADARRGGRKRTRGVRKFLYKQQYTRPEARRISDGVIMRLDNVYEVDPELMGKHFKQQNMPRWDTERIVEAVTITSTGCTTTSPPRPWSPGRRANSAKVPAAVPGRGRIRHPGQVIAPILPRGGLWRT